MSEELFEQHLQEDGYIMGTDPCLDQCWKNFKQCLEGTNPSECIAQLEFCKRSCAQRTNEEGAEP